MRNFNSLAGVSELPYNFPIINVSCLLRGVKLSATVIKKVVYFFREEVEESTSNIYNNMDFQENNGSHSM